MTYGDMKIYEKTLDLANRLDDTFLELGRLLRQVQDNNPQLFEKLLKVPGLSRRKAYYLVQIDRAFDDLPIDKSLALSIGWTKLSVIAPHFPSDALHLLNLAKTHTAHQLRQIIKGEAPMTNPRVVMLYFTEQEYELYSSALLKFGAKKTGRGLAFQRRALLGMAKKVTSLK